MENIKLINLRKSKGLSQKELANLAAMEQTTYSRKERGLTFITESEWERLATALKVPVDEIKEVQKPNIINENCVFNDSAVNIQYINIPKDVWDIVLKYNKKLEDELDLLKKSNST